MRISSLIRPPSLATAMALVASAAHASDLPAWSGRAVDPSAATRVQLAQVRQTTAGNPDCELGPWTQRRRIRDLDPDGRYAPSTHGRRNPADRAFAGPPSGDPADRGGRRDDPASRTGLA